MPILGIIASSNFTEAPSYIAVATTNSPYRFVYPWTNASGFGTKYANSSGGQAFRSTDITFSPSANTIVTTSTGPNYAYAFPWSASGFGTQYGSPSLPNQTNGVAFNPAGNVVAFGYVGGSRATVYPWSPGFGTAYSTPFLGRDGQKLTFSPSGNAIAITVDNASEPLKTFAWSNATGFGTRYAEVPAQSPAYGAGAGLSFNAAGNIVAFGHQSMQQISVFPWNPGVGTRYSNPSPALNGSGTDVAFNPAGNVIAVTSSAANYLNAWPWSNSTGFGTKYSTPSGSPSNQATGVQFHPSGNTVAFSANASPYMFVYPWSNSTGFGTRYSNPATLPDDGNAIAFG
jgi:hypothetical protein